MEASRGTVGAGAAGPALWQVLDGAKAWGRRWRVAIKADMVLHAGRKPKLNVRFMLTDINGSAQHIYCQRGDTENRLRELKAGLPLGHELRLEAAVEIARHREPDRAPAGQHAPWRRCGCCHGRPPRAESSLGGRSAPFRECVR